MKHKIKNCTLIFLLFFLFSCGFKAINSKNDNLIEIEDIQINGEKRLGYYLKNELLLNSKKDGENKIKVILDINKNKKAKIKDVTGKVSRYEINFNAQLSILDLRNNLKNKKSFSSSVDFTVSKNHSDTINAEKKATKNGMVKLGQDMSTYLILYYKNQ